jgi:hypothetical protein
MLAFRPAGTRTRSMNAAARGLSEQECRRPCAAFRNTGKHAMLAEPLQVCGVYIGLFGLA